MAADGSNDHADETPADGTSSRRAQVAKIQENAADFDKEFGKALTTLGIEDYDLKMGRSSGACIHLMQDIRTINRLSNNGRMDDVFIERRESWHFGGDDSTETPQRMFSAERKSRSWPTPDNNQISTKTSAIHRDAANFAAHLERFLNETRTQLLGILQESYNSSESDSVSLLSSPANLPALERRLGGDLKDKLAAYRFIEQHKPELISHPFITQSRPEIAALNEASRPQGYTQTLAHAATAPSATWQR